MSLSEKTMWRLCSCEKVVYIHKKENWSYYNKTKEVKVKFNTGQSDKSI